MMIYDKSVQTVQDLSLLPGGHLVLCQFDQRTFGITCQLGGQKFVVLLRDKALPNTAAPFVTPVPEVSGVTFGSEFIVGYDANSISLDASPDLGDLIIRKETLCLAAHRGSTARSFGGQCVVDLSTGEISNGHPMGAVIKRWSIGVVTGLGRRPVKIKHRDGPL